MRQIRQGRPSAGFTLVEMMVGLAIGLFLVLVMGAIYIGTKSAFNSQSALSRLQENARFAADLLANDLRMSGFRGCNGQAGRQPVLHNALASTALPYNYANNVFVSHSVGGTWSPSLDGSLGVNPSSSGDVLTLYRPSGHGWSLNGPMADAVSALPVTPTGGFTQGDILMVADCNAASIFQASNAAPGAAGSIEHQVSGLAPGQSTADLGHVYGNDASVYRMQSVSYYLADSALQPGSLALWSRTTPTYDGLPGATELVTGVEKMLVTLGVDTNGDQAADVFVTADQVTDWTAVVSVRVQLVLVSPTDNVTSAPQPYTFAGAVVTPVDRRMRTVVSVFVSLRNSAP